MSRDCLGDLSGHMSRSAVVGRNLVSPLFDHQRSGDAPQSALVQEEWAGKQTHLCFSMRNTNFSLEDLVQILEHQIAVSGCMIINYHLECGFGCMW